MTTAHEGDLQVGAGGGQSGGEEEPPPPAAEAAGLDFCCKYCDKKFGNKQALGGHQNGHRIERAMDPEIIAKRIRRGGGFMDAHFSGFPPLGAQVNLNQYFLPGHFIPSPEIPTTLPNPYPLFPPAVPENHSPHSQVSPPAMTAVSGANSPPGVPADSPVTPSPASSSIVINSNPRNTPAEINKDGELDLTLKL